MIQPPIVALIRRFRVVSAFAVCAVPFAAHGQARIATPPAISLIKEADLRADMAVMAGDGFRGREAGTLDEMRASMWTADQLAKIGVKPLGEDGTWFQWFNMRRTRVSTVSSSVRIGGKSFALWTEATPTTNTEGDVVGTTVFAGDGTDTTIDVRGRIAVVTLRPTSEGTRTTINTAEYRAVRQGLTVQGNAMTQRGAAAVIIVADAMGEAVYDGVGKLQARGTYNVLNAPGRYTEAAITAARGGAAAGGGRGGAGAAGGRGGRGGVAPRAVPVIFVRRSALTQLRENGQGAEIHIRSESFDTPSVNIIGWCAVPIPSCATSTWSSVHTRTTMACASPLKVTPSGTAPTTTPAPASHSSRWPVHG